MTVIKGVVAGVMGSLAIGVWLTAIPGFFGMGSFAFLWGLLASPLAGIATGLAARGTEGPVTTRWMLGSAIALALGVGALALPFAIQ